jgi:glycosyltransferase 2 family protein
VPFVIAGVSVQLVVDGLWPGQAQLGWLDYTWGFALAFVIGFVTPGSPGGIGVRDAVLFGLYQAPLGPALAASLTLATRVVYILGDLATFTVASLVRPQRSP